MTRDNPNSIQVRQRAGSTVDGSDAQTPKARDGYIPDFNDSASYFTQPVHRAHSVDRILTGGRPTIERQSSNVSPNSFFPLHSGPLTNRQFQQQQQDVAAMTGLADHRRDLSVLQGTPMYSSNNDNNGNNSNNNASSPPPSSGSSSIAAKSFGHGHHQQSSFDGSFTFDGPASSTQSLQSHHMHPSFGDGHFTTGLGPFAQLDVGQQSPRFLSDAGTEPTGTPRDGSIVDGYFDMGEDRRPSVASVTTNASSTGSKTSLSRRLNGKLHGFFGDSNSDHHHHLPHLHHSASTSGPINYSDPTLATHRNATGPPTPNGALRPKTPLPNADVLPFLYQDVNDVETFGEAPPIRTQLVNDTHRYGHHKDEPQPTTHTHKTPFHRKDKTKGLRPTTANSDNQDGRVPNHRRDIFSPAYMGSQSNLPRATSPSPSVRSANSTRHEKASQGAFAAGQQGPPGGDKKSFWPFRKGKAGKKDEEAGNTSDSPKSTRSGRPSVAKPNDAQVTNGRVRMDSMPKRGSASNAGGAGAEFVINPRMYEFMPADQAPSRKNLTGSAPLSKFKATRRGDTYDRKDSTGRRHPEPENNFFLLDTDLMNMEGIVQPMTPPEQQEQFQPFQEGDQPRSGSGPKALWAAPESWAVKPTADDVDPELLAEGELETVGDKGRKQSLVQYCIRVFRADGSFTTLSASINSSVTDLLSLLGKKSFLQDDLSNYVIIFRKQDLARILNPQERPLLLQKKLLEQAGYTEHDHLEEIGREDHSYLCRFTFLPSRVGGHSLDPETGFAKVHRFNHVDLQGKNLLTIPIAFYQRASDISTLNLSRNLSLDVPLDFIQACTNLRQIQFRSNEAFRLPTSFAHIQGLTYLDVSNNKLEDLSSTRLDKNENLIALIMSNNRISSLPEEFNNFRFLNSLRMGSNSLTTWPAVICELVTLDELDLQFNKIESVPEEIGALKGLQKLILMNNNIKGPLPEGLAQCKALKELDIRHNPIHVIDVLTQLENLETLYAGHCNINSFECQFDKLKALHLNNNKITTFTVPHPMPTLGYLNLSEGKLASFSGIICENLPNLEKLILDRNTITVLPPQFGKMNKLGHISCCNNSLSALPAEIGLLTELRYLDLHGNNISSLPPQIWTMVSLQTLNLSSNVLAAFPKPPALAVNLPMPSAVDMPLATTEPIDELSPLDTSRRQSTVSNGLLTPSPNNASRKGSTVSLYSQNSAANRKASVVSKASSDSSSTVVGSSSNGSGTFTPGPVHRKDSAASNRTANTFAQTLRNLYLADNRLPDEVFEEISLLSELRILNLSYNEIIDVPARKLSRLSNLVELHLSGNEMTSLPTDDLESITALKVLHINGNRFQTLPAELGKIRRLNVLDVGSNALKYNISNWPYDWNWNWNLELKYLNLSGNRRLEIKANFSATGPRDQSFTDFNALKSLRILGLMDVTTTNPSFPDQTEDCRVRTSGSVLKNMAYGMADTLGRCEHLSIIDMVVPRFRGNEDEILLGFFDGQILPHTGNKMAKWLQEHLQFHLQDELRKMRPGENPADAMRRTFLSLDREIATVGHALQDDKKAGSKTPHGPGVVAQITLTKDDVAAGATSTLVYIAGNDMYVANVGDAMAILVQANGESKVLTKKHDPLLSDEIDRVREAGGWVSRNAKVNDILDVSRAFGYVQQMPSIIAAPTINNWKVTESDEFLIIANKELWDFVSYRTAVDIARTEREDLMRAAQKLRDFAIGYGASSKIMVMVLGVGDLTRTRRKMRSQSVSAQGAGWYDNDDAFPIKRKGRSKQEVSGDSTLGRLDPEVAPPEGDVCLVFTDIKGSTFLWETCPIAMRSAIKEHNEIMRRQLRAWGGYEVKTEGDAFMVSFQSASAALLWCFGVQLALLSSEGWPNEILKAETCQELYADDENKTLLYRGISVRMGIHFGAPVCEKDPITRRMDYFGPMVNRAARISGVADGGQITVSTDYLTELRRLESLYGQESEAPAGQGDDIFGEEILDRAIRQNLRTLKNMNGYGLKEMGERKLKGLENPELIYIVFPPSLAGREQLNTAKLQAPTEDGLTPEMLLPLFTSCLRLEKACSELNSGGVKSLFITDNTGSIEMVSRKIQEGVSDAGIWEFVEGLVTRVENSITTLYLRTLTKGITNIAAEAQQTPASDVLTFTTPLMDILSSLKQLMSTDPRLMHMIASPTTTTSSENPPFSPISGESESGTVEIGDEYND